MLKIAIFETVDEYGKELAALYENYLKSRNIEGRIWIFDRGADLLREIRRGRYFDIYVLEETTPEKEGIRVGLQIRKLDREGFVFMLADSTDGLLEAINKVWIFQYFVRPFDSRELLDALDRAMPLLLKRIFAGIAVKTKMGVVRLLFDEILYAELSDRTVRYVCKVRTEESLSLKGSFRSAVEPLLADERFVMCGASFAVNLFYVRRVDRGGAELLTGEYLQIPKSACAPLLTAWMEYWEKESKWH